MRTMFTLEARPATIGDACTLALVAAAVFRDVYRSAFDSDLQVEDFIAANFTPSAIRIELESENAWYSIGLVNDVAAGSSRWNAQRRRNVWAVSLRWSCRNCMCSDSFMAVALPMC